RQAGSNFPAGCDFERLVPALDLALGHRMIGRTAQVLDVAVAKPLGQVASDITRTVVGQQPGSVSGPGLIKPTGPQRQVEGSGDVLGLHIGAQLPGLGIPGRGDPADDAALRHAATEPGLHWRDARQAPSSPRRAAEGPGDSGEGRSSATAMVEIAGMANVLR